MANHLLDATSPYLLQHAHNPVEWYPWGAPALERARRDGKPIFLSIGYAACHWCHVMERECFENPAIAAVMNEHFVNIKVDREERPDLDELYMLATQLMTGQGGWPMSVWLTPELMPFYAGTYFPPADGFGRPGFPRLLLALQEAWAHRRGELAAQAQRVVEAIRLHADESGAAEEIENRKLKIENVKWLRLAIEQFADRFDEVHGGLGGAPKFPPHQALQLWLALVSGGEVERTGLSGPEQRVLAYKLALTLDRMKDGGIYDQIGGGFARYSTDERWLVPHFEKMLYDAAQLAPVYAGVSVVLGNAEDARVARETLDFYLREMGAEGGGFYSSLDADSEGAEGRYYVWTAGDVRAALPVGDDAELMLAHFGISEEGNWAESPVEGGNVLAIAQSTEVLAEKHGVTVEAMQERLKGLRERLREARDKRTRPGLDDKILTSWNGLMLSALAVTGRILQEPRYIAAAERQAEFLLTHHLTDAGLQRVSRGGAAAHTPGFLDDHAYLLNGLADLMEAVPERSAEFEGTAIRLADTLLRDFQDTAHGGFFFTGPRHEKLFVRMKNAADNATPSANGVAIRALLRLGRHTGVSAYRAAAMRGVVAFQTHIDRRPEYFPTILLALLEEESSAVFARQMTETIENRELKIENRRLLTLTVEPVAPVVPGASFEIALHVAIAAGYHIQATEAEEAVRTNVRVRSVGAAIIAAQNWRYPAAQDIHGTRGYAGVIDIRGICTLVANALPGEHVLRMTLTAQACTATACLAPQQVTVELPVTIKEHAQ